MQTQDVSYRYVQFAIEYSGLTSKENPIWFGPDECLSDTFDSQPGSILASCTVGDMPSAIAELAIDFTCTATPSANHEIKLLVGLGDGESHVRDASGVRHSDQTDTESIFIDCVEPQTADMHLEIKGGDAVCDTVPEANSCTVPADGSLTVSISTDDPPPQGYYGFVSELLYGGLQYNPVLDNLLTYPFPHEGAEQEVVWPGSQYAARDPFFAITGTEGYVRHYADSGNQTFAGNLVELSMTCATPGVHELTLTSYNYPDRNDGSKFFLYPSGDNQDNAVLLNEEDTIDITCLAPPTATPTSTSTPTNTATPTPTRTRIPPQLGGVASYPDAGSSTDVAVWVAVSAALAALGGGAWYARRRVRS
jgi:hypothetical protein